MKRPRESQASTSADAPAKRRKASQACESCRKHKTRCELPEDINAHQTLRCHRCKVLNIACSFESTNIIHFNPGANGTTAAVIIDPSVASSSSTVTNSPPLPLDCYDDPTCPMPESDHVPVVSPYDVPREYTRLVRSARDLIVEDLLPCPLIPWGPMSVPGGFDWTEAPILSVRDLSNSWQGKPKVKRPEGMAQDQYLSNILSPSQINRLIDIFEERYAPWLCEPRVLRTETLDLVSCSIASRHLDSLTRRSMSPRLLSLLDRSFLSKLSDLPPSNENILSLIMLSLWCPFVFENSIEPPKERPNLLKTAIDMANSLHLPEASLKATNLKDQEKQYPHELATAIADNRLWVLLSSVDSMLCLGTGRNSVTKRSAIDYKPMEIFRSSSAQERERSLRLSLQGQLMDLAEIGGNISLTGPHNVPHFYETVHALLTRMECLYTPLAPLPLVSRYDKFYFHMLMLQYYCSRLLTTHHALRELRTVLEGRKNHSWIKTKYHGTPMVACWGRDSITTAQALLMVILSNNNDQLLYACPDIIFSMISFAATWLIITNFSMHQLKCAPLGTACDKLITAAMELLSRLSSGPEDTLAKYAHVIATLMEVWNRKRDGIQTMEELSAANTTAAEVESAAANASADILHRPSDPAALADPESHGYFGNVDSGNTDIFMDPTFWSSFMDNLTMQNDTLDWSADILSGHSTL